MIPPLYSFHPPMHPARQDDGHLPPSNGIEDPEAEMRDRADSGGARAGAQAGGSRVSNRSSGLGLISADRPIFTLSVAADLLGLHPRTLRIYEEKGLVVPARTDGNRRRYSQNDIQRFQIIRQLTRNGVNLEGVRIILDMADELTRLGADPAAIIERNSHGVLSGDA